MIGRYLPALARVPWVPIGTWPTPLVAVDALGKRSWWKCEGDSHAHYGGNKVRTLEAWLGHARDRDAKRIWAIGAFGSNHTIATVVHARAAGIDAGAIVFPQPTSEWAVENCAALIASGVPIVRLRSVVEVPFAALRIARRERDAIVMPPGGATPIGTLGALAGAFELAAQIEAGLAPPPARIVVAAGSTCTSAGLLAGILLARATGAWPWPRPLVHAVRVTPWPVTSRTSIVALAARTLARVASLGGPRAALRELSSGLAIDGDELGPGYGRPTIEARAAAVAFAHGPRLDGVYSAKAAAALLRLQRRDVGPLVFWSSKSSARVAGDEEAARGWLG